MRLVIALLIGIVALVASAAPSSAGPICWYASRPGGGTVTVCIPGTG